MTASYSNTDRLNKSRRTLTFPVMIPSTCSTIYSPLQNLSSSRLIPEHYSSTWYSPLQNLSSSRLIPEHYSNTWYSHFRIFRLPVWYLNTTAALGTAKFRIFLPPVWYLNTTATLAIAQFRISPFDISWTLEDHCVRNSISLVQARKGLWDLWSTKWHCDKFVSQLPLFPPVSIIPLHYH